jgi:pyruvate/2-oxoglutarate dehydrogenase complex dihydrolipoamide acyltransferase (E2) component
MDESATQANGGAAGRREITRLATIPMVVSTRNFAFGLPMSDFEKQVLMPSFSTSSERGSIARWLKKEGEQIKSGDVIAEIETDKATMEVEATDEGTLGKILIPEGTTDIAVNTPIATILAGSESGKVALSADQGQPARVSGEIVSDDDLTYEEFWTLVKQAALAELRASRIDTQQAHEAYIRERINPILNHV